MKRNGILFLILVLLLMVFGLYFALSGKKGSLDQRDRNFAIPGEELEVVRVIMQEQNGPLLLLEKDNTGTWRVNDRFRANESAVKELLGTLRHLTVRLPVAISDQPQVNAALEQEGVLVSIYARTHWISLPGNIRLIPRTKRVKRFLAGEDTPDGESTYMRRLKSDMPFAVHVPGIQGGLADLFMTREALWRDPVVLDLDADQIKSVEVDFPGRENESFAIEVSPGGISLLQNGQPLDSAQVNWSRIMRFLESFSTLHYERLLVGDADSLTEGEMQMPHFMEISVSDRQGMNTQMRFFYRTPSPEEGKDLATETNVDPDRFFLQVNGGDYALAQYFVFSRIMRNLDFFLTVPQNGEDG